MTSTSSPRSRRPTSSDASSSGPLDRRTSRYVIVRRSTPNARDASKRAGGRLTLGTPRSPSWRCACSVGRSHRGSVASPGFVGPLVTPALPSAATGLAPRTAMGSATVVIAGESATSAPARSAPAGARSRRAGRGKNTAKRMTPRAVLKDHAATGTARSGSIAKLKDQSSLGLTSAGAGLPPMAPPRPVVPSPASG